MTHGSDISMQSCVFHSSCGDIGYNLFKHMHGRTQVCRCMHTYAQIKVKIHLCVITDIIDLVNVFLYKPPAVIGLVC